MEFAGGIRRHNPASGRYLFGPHRFRWRHYRGISSSSILVVLPRVWFRWFYRGRCATQPIPYRTEGLR